MYIALLAYLLIFRITFGGVGFTDPTYTWMTLIARYPLLDIFLFTVGGVVGDSLQGQIRGEWIAPIVGLVGVVITAVVSIISASMG